MLCAGSAAHAPTSSGFMTLRIISWNLRHGGRGRAAAIARQLSEWKPDVLVLQEYRDVPEIQRGVTDSGLNHVLSPRHDSERRNRVLIASKHRLKRSPMPVTPQPERVAAARVLTGRQALDIIAVHIPNRNSGVKYEFLNALTTHLGVPRSRRMLLLGDMNSGIKGTDDETSFFNRRESDWTASFSRAPWCDAFRRMHGDLRAFSWRSPNAGNGFRIDHAFVTSSLASQLTRCEYLWSATDGIANSDHAALLLELDATLDPVSE